MPPYEIKISYLKLKLLFDLQILKRRLTQNMAKNLPIIMITSKMPMQYIDQEYWSSFNSPSCPEEYVKEHSPM